MHRGVYGKFCMLAVCSSCDISSALVLYSKQRLLNGFPLQLLDCFKPLSQPSTSKIDFSDGINEEPLILDSQRQRFTGFLRLFVVRTKVRWSLWALFGFLWEGTQWTARHHKMLYKRST